MVAAVRLPPVRVKKAQLRVDLGKSKTTKQMNGASSIDRFLLFVPRQRNSLAVMLDDLVVGFGFSVFVFGGVRDDSYCINDFNDTGSNLF